MTFFWILIAGTVGFLLGYYSAKNPGWTAPILAWVKTKIAKKAS